MQETGLVLPCNWPCAPFWGGTVEWFVTGHVESIGTLFLSSLAGG